MKYLQRQQFSFTKTSIEIKVSPEKPESCKLQHITALQIYVISRLSSVRYFSR